jgi:hypothetical protein
MESLIANSLDTFEPIVVIYFRWWSYDWKSLVRCKPTDPNLFYQTNRLPELDQLLLSDIQRIVAKNKKH